MRHDQNHPEGIQGPENGTQGATEWILTIPAVMGLRTSRGSKTARRVPLWLNANQNPPRFVKARLVKAWRQLGRVSAQNAGLPQGLGRVHILATIHRARAGRADAGNFYPTAKAVVDGLVDYGLVADDHSGIVTGPDMREGEPGEPCLVLLIKKLS